MEEVRPDLQHLLPLLRYLSDGRQATQQISVQQHSIQVRKRVLQLCSQTLILCGMGL